MAACISPNTGKPLSCYETREEAEESARYQKEKNGMDYHVYQCDRCGFYHLAPNIMRVNPARGICGCTDSKGKAKKLYFTYSDALIAKERAESQRDVRLHIYDCPEGLGYHLAHDKEYERKVKRRNAYQRWSYMDSSEQYEEEKSTIREDKQSPPSSTSGLISRMKSEYGKATFKERIGLFIFISTCILLIVVAFLIR